MEQADLLKESHGRGGPRTGPWSRGMFPWQGERCEPLCVCVSCWVQVALSRQWEGNKAKVFRRASSTKGNGRSSVYLERKLIGMAGTCRRQA